jgi:GNAT superfamily N-acetyltransferase
VGFALSLPDYNQVLRRLGGSLLPFGWLKALWFSRRIDRMRTVALGVEPAERGRGIEAGLYLETTRRGAPLGLRRSECSWMLARNTAMNRIMESLGARVYRRYRLYSGPVPPTGNTRPEA